jgi:Uracil-DNA glycosylase
MEPEVLLVFECENYQTRDIQWIIELRNKIRTYFQVERVYYTFMVRCQPKACVLSQGSTLWSTGKLANHNSTCLLNEQPCEGIPIKPKCDEIINCMYFLLEEIDILKPQYVILFGSRVEEYVLKSYGIFDIDSNFPAYRYESATLLTTSDTKKYKADEIKRLAELANIIG